MNFKVAVKEYTQIFTLINEARTDVRRLRLTVTPTPRPVKAKLLMKCPARETLVQEIPISNTSDRDYVIKATIVSDVGVTVFQVNSIWQSG
jgi:hypothetical protein